MGRREREDGAKRAVCPRVAVVRMGRRRKMCRGRFRGGSFKAVCLRGCYIYIYIYIYISENLFNLIFVS